MFYCDCILQTSFSPKLSFFFVSPRLQSSNSTLSKRMVFGNILIFYLFHVSLLCALPKYYSQFYYFSFFFTCAKHITTLAPSKPAHPPACARRSCRSPLVFIVCSIRKLDHKLYCATVIFRSFNSVGPSFYIVVIL